jgi:transcriptional regulator with XRE-family HTH domain
MAKQRTTEWEAAVGVRIGELRRGAGMSQSQLARAAGVSFRSLQNWEQGHRPVALEAAAKLAQALGVSLDVLAGLVPPRKKKGGGK